MKYNTEQIGKTIKSEREKKGWSQEKLGKKLHISGKQISIYEKGNLPPLENLLALCDLFDCELGYLLGEDTYSKGTKIETEIYEKTGLLPETVKSLEYITSPNSRFHFGYESKVFRELLNKLIASDGFVTLMDAMYSLNDCILLDKQIDENLTASFDSATVQQAYTALTGTADYEHDTSLPPLPDNVIAAYNMIDKGIDKHRELSYTNKIARYELNEAFILLISELFGKNTTT